MGGVKSGLTHQSTERNVIYIDIFGRNCLATLRSMLGQASHRC